MGLEPKITKNPDGSSDVLSIAATAAMKAGEALLNSVSTLANAISSAAAGAAAGAADGSSKVLLRPTIDADTTVNNPRQTQDRMPENGAIAKIVAEVLQERSLSVKRPDGINHATAGHRQVLSVSSRSESLPHVRKSDLFESMERRSGSREEINTDRNSSKAETGAKESSEAPSLSCSKSTETPTQPSTQNAVLKPTIQSIDDNNIQLCKKTKSDLRSSSSDAPDEENRKEVSRSFSPQLLEACSIEGKVRNQQTGKKENELNAEQKQVCTPTRQPTAPGQTCKFLPPIRKDGDPLNAHKGKRESAVEKVEPPAATNSNSKDITVSARVERPDTQERGVKGEQFQGPTCIASTNRERTSNLTGLNNVISQAEPESAKSVVPGVNPTKPTDSLDGIGKGDTCTYKQNRQPETTTTTTRTSAGANDIRQEGNSCKNHLRTITDIDGKAIPIRTKSTGDNLASSDPSNYCHGQKNGKDELAPICQRSVTSNTTGQPIDSQFQPKGAPSTNSSVADGKCTSGQGDLRKNSQTDQPAGDIRPTGSINGNSSTGPLEGTCTRKQPGQSGQQGPELPVTGDGRRRIESCHQSEPTGPKDQSGKAQVPAQSNQSLERSPATSTSSSILERPATVETSVRQSVTVVPERLSANAKGSEIVDRAITAANKETVGNPDPVSNRPVQVQTEASKLLERTAAEPLKIAEVSRISNQGSERIQESKSPPHPTQEKAVFVNDAGRIAQIVDQYFGRVPEPRNHTKEQAITEIVRQLRDNGIIGGFTGLSESKAIDLIRQFVQQREGAGRVMPSEANQLQQANPGQNPTSASETTQQASKQAALQQLLTPNSNTITWTYDQNGRWQAIRQGDASTSINPAKIPGFEQFGLRPDLSPSQGSSKSDREQITIEKNLPTKTNIDSPTIAQTGQKPEESIRHNQSHHWQSPGGQKHQPISGEKADNLTDKRFPERSNTEEKPIEPAASPLANTTYQPWVGIIGIPNLSGSGRTNDERGDKTGSANGKPQPTDTRRPDRRLRYLVQPGDTLESIALKKLGDSRFAGLILTINRSVIKFMNQGLIRVPALQTGQILWLPSQLELEIHRKHFFPTGKKPIPNPANKVFAPDEFVLHASLKPGDSRQQPDLELVDVDPIQAPPALVLYDGEQPLAGTDHYKPGEKSKQPADSNFEAPHLPTASPLSIILLRIRHTGNRTLVPLASTVPQKQESPLRRCWIVESGDSLRSIALKDGLMADSSMWRLIARINALPEYTEKTGEPLVRLQVGQEILLPNADEIAQFRLLQNLSDAARPELNASPALTAASQQANRQMEIEARMLINKLSDCCRIMVAAPSTVSETFMIRLQATVDARWTTIAAYESRIGKTVRFTYNPDGSRTPFHMDLPAAVVRDMAEEDFKRNWRHYIEDFTDKNKPADSASAG